MKIIKLFALVLTFALVVAMLPITSSAAEWIPANVRNVVFNAEYYAAKYPDIAAQCGNDANALYRHFSDYGAQAGLQGSPIFNAKYYLDNNGDLKNAFGSNYKNAIIHFSSYGINEKRATAAPANLGSKFEARITDKNEVVSVVYNGSNVLLGATAQATNSQIWVFERQSSGAYKITNKSSGKVIDLSNASVNNGSNIQTYTSNNSDAQRWNLFEIVPGKYVISSVIRSAKVLDISGGSIMSGTNIQLYGYNGSAAQCFVIRTSGTFDYMTPVNLGSGFYANIRGVGSNKFLTLGSNANVCISAASPYVSQLWHFTRHSDGSYRIINQQTGAALDVNNASNTSGTNIQTYTSNNTNAQRWFIFNVNGYYVFAPKSSSTRVLDVFNGDTASGTNVQLYTLNSSAAQCFKVEKKSGSYIDMIVKSDIGTNFYTNIEVGGKRVSVSGTNVVLENANSGLNQFWKFERQSDGSYMIINVANGYVLDVAGAKNADGTNIQTYQSNNSAAQRWHVFIQEGKYIFRSAISTNRVVDVSGGNLSAGANIQLYSFNNSAAQKFTLTNTTTKKPTSGNAQAILTQAKWVADFCRNNGFTYGSTSYNPALNNSERLVSCDRFVGWVLYRAGYTAYQPSTIGLNIYGHNYDAGTYSLEWFCKAHGFTKITNINDVKAGDVIFVGDSQEHVSLSAAMRNYPDHVFIAASNYGADGCTYRYDAGSTARLVSVQPSYEALSKPGKEFRFAYRAP